MFTPAGALRTPVANSVNFGPVGGGIWQKLALRLFFSQPEPQSWTGFCNKNTGVDIFDTKNTQKNPLIVTLNGFCKSGIMIARRLVIALGFIAAVRGTSRLYDHACMGLGLLADGAILMWSVWLPSCDGAHEGAQD